MMRPLAAAALLAALQGASAGTSTFDTTMCANITPSVWRKAACWTPSPPTEADTVVIPAGPPVYVNTTWDVDSKWNYTYVEALVIDGLTVNKGARLVVLQGSFELRGTASIQGALSLQAPQDGEQFQARNTLNKADLKEDTASRALGLRDCAYTPIGFTPRLCGAGTYVVEAGGQLSVSGLYAAIFSRVQVKTGGTYGVSQYAHPFGLVQNEGSVTVGDAYWHGLLENKENGIANLAGLIWFDEYSHAGEGNDSKPEKFTQDPFINEGTMKVSHSVRSTHFLYEWLDMPMASGEYQSAFRNRGNGKMELGGEITLSGLTVEGGEVTVETVIYTGPCVNNGHVHIKDGSKLSCAKDLSGTGSINVSGVLNAEVCEAGDMTVSGTVYATNITVNTLELVANSSARVTGATMCSFASAVTVGHDAILSCTDTQNAGTVRVAGALQGHGFANSETGWLALEPGSDTSLTTNFTNANKTGGLTMLNARLYVHSFVWPTYWTEMRGSLKTTSSLTLRVPFGIYGELTAGNMVAEQSLDFGASAGFPYSPEIKVSNFTAHKTTTISGYLQAENVVNTGDMSFGSRSELFLTGDLSNTGSLTLTNTSDFQVGDTCTNTGSFKASGPTGLHFGKLYTNGSIIVESSLYAGHLQNDGVFQVAGSIMGSYFGNSKKVVGHGSVGTISNTGDFTFVNTRGAPITFVQNSGTANISGVPDTIQNDGDLTMSFSSDVAKVSQLNTSAGSRTLLTGDNTELNEMKSAGVIVFDSMQVWVHRVECDSCHFFFADDAELHLIGPSGWRAPRGMLKVESGLAERGTPAVCTHDGACHKDPCPYEGHSMVDRCFVNGTIPGVLYFVSEKEFCYTCTHGHPLGIVNDAAAMRQLGDGRMEIEEEVARPRRLALAPVYSFKHATVESDGTGALVMTTALHLHGDDALRVKRTRVHALTEHSRPVFVGGGRLTLQKRSELRLGLEAILDDGGSIDALPGSAVIVEHFASVVARNHSLRVAKGAKMRVDGTMHFHKHSTVESCGRSVGAGTLVMDDPAESARTCAEAATCLAECKTDADCGSGLCSSCSGAHGDSQGVCVEPGCQTDDDCSLNGQCQGGACVSCDLNGLPFVGAHCTELRPSSATYGKVTGRNPMTGNPANLSYSAFVQTIAPPGCAVGGPDDMLESGGLMVQPRARNMKSFDHVMYFDYSFPAVGCNWTLGICAGLGAGGCQCNRTTASDCGCEPTCTQPKLPPGVCSSYITTAKSMSELGDCGPTARGCFCGRDGVQQVHGTKGCPSNPFMMPAGGNSTDVLMYYNMGDGKSVGLATGPKTGPWTVVKEPVAEGVQDVFVMKNSQGTFHMFATGVKDQNVVHGFSRDGKTWTVVDAPVLPMTDGSTTFKTRTHPWIVHVETAYPSPKGRKMTVMTAVTDSSGLQTVVSQDFASVVEKKH